MLRSSVLNGVQELMGTFFATKGLMSLPPVLRRILLIFIDALILPSVVYKSRPSIAREGSSSSDVLLPSS